MLNYNDANETSRAEKKRNDWIISIKKKLDTGKKPLKLSIYKVPNKLLKLKEDAYTPSIVSIGPFHHNNKAVSTFEEHKWRYMLHLFMRIPAKCEPTLQDCANAILELEEEARRCYSEKIDIDEYQFAEILLVDGCFLLELFLKYSNIENHEEDTVEDPLINNAQTIATLQHDLALLENQIPFSVLEILFDIIKYHVPQPLGSLFTEHNMATLALLFFKLALGLSNEAIRSKSSELSGKHLLDILHNFYAPTIVKRPETLDILELPISDKIPQSQDLQRSGLRDCATKLLKVGIQFAADTADANENLLDIKFRGIGLVTMPPLHIQEAITETIFRNLIAFEQCDRTNRTSHPIASYVFLMRSLLHSSYDVDLLRERGIIKNHLSDVGGSEDVTALFKSICEEVVLNDSYFSMLCAEVNNYYYNRMPCWHWRRLFLVLRHNWITMKYKWHEYAFVFRRDYSSDPWTFISVNTAVIALILTAMQTYYTGFSYYHH